MNSDLLVVFNHWRVAQKSFGNGLNSQSLAANDVESLKSAVRFGEIKVHADDCCVLSTEFLFKGDNMQEFCTEALGLRAVHSIDMETAGVLQAADKAKVPFLSFRGISDNVAQKHLLDTVGPPGILRATAMRNATLVLLGFLRHNY